MTTKWHRPPMTIEDLCPAAGLMGIFGASGCYKTNNGLDLGIAASTGGTWAGRRVSQCNILYISYEMERYLLQTRLERMLRARYGENVNPHVLNQVYDRLFVVGSDNLPYNENAWVLPKKKEVIAHYVQQANAGMVIFDTLRRAHIGAEVDDEHMNNVLGAFDFIRRRTGATVVYIHHTARGGNKARGSGVLECNSLAMVFVEKAKSKDGKTKLQRVKFDKQNHGPEAEEPVYYMVNSDGSLTFADQAEVSLQVAIDAHNDELDAEERAREAILDHVRGKRLQKSEITKAKDERLSRDVGNEKVRCALINTMLDEGYLFVEKVGRNAYITVRERVVPLMFEPASA